MSPRRSLTRKVEPSRMLIVSLAMSCAPWGRCRTVARRAAALQGDMAGRAVTTRAVGGLSAVEIIDVSVAIRPGMVTYPGDPAVTLERVTSLANGAAVNLSRLDFGVHSGTHVDAPVHFIDGAPAAEALPLDVLIGSARVLDLTAADRLDSSAF